MQHLQWLGKAIQMATKKVHLGGGIKPFLEWNRLNEQSSFTRNN